MDYGLETKDYGQFILSLVWIILNNIAILCQCKCNLELISGLLVVDVLQHRFLHKSNLSVRIFKIKFIDMEHC